MKNLRIQLNIPLIMLLTFVLLIESGNQTIAADNSNKLFFNKEPSLNNEELDEMRGGFIARNGMIIDFSLSTNTLVDGKLINQIALNSMGLTAGSDTLKNIIQIGEGNTAFEGKIDMNNLPEVLTIVQNNIDNLTIQQVNLFDITVEKMDNFIQQSVTPEIDFQNTIRISP